MSTELTLNAKSSRASKARFAAVFDNKALRVSFWLVVVTLFVGFAWLVFVDKSALGYLLFGLTGPLFILLFWYYGELKNLQSQGDMQNVTDISLVLDRKVLAKVTNDITSAQLCKIIAKQDGGLFYASRFAIGLQILEVGLTSVPVGAVWTQAVYIAQHTGVKQIDSGTIAAALILSLPNADGFLAHFKLDKNDIVAGAQWLQQMQKVIERHRRKKNYGGIGRDLSFGWAPLLNQVGYNITESILNGGLIRRPVKSRETTIDQVLHTLAQPGRRNVTLVGEVGVGKTTLVHSLAQRLLENPKTVPPELRYRQVISLDASNLIANAKGRGQLEELLIHIFNEALSAKNVILFLDDAELFLKDGTGSVDLSNLLLPVLEGGALQIILSLSEQEWLRLSQSNPGLAQLLNRVIVKPLDRAETVQVIEDETLLIEGKHKVTLMRESIKTAYDLAERFIHEQAFPGKALKLLEAAASFPEQTHFVTTKSVQQAVEKSFDVKVQTADTQAERDTLLNLEQKIHERMINQTRAVKLVSDALRRARSGVRNQNKPIGTFLFLGPTGVGKTELSKSLADVYFGGEGKMVRVDLNEYSHANDTARLLAVGANDPYSLCAQIAKQPFSVVLLDEIEKAHPNVLNLLLQMLDEGMLRDAENKPVSFRDSIIIATSNAGADAIRAHIDKGEQLEQFEDAFVNELINKNIFRPEFLNRFDEIILFRPLNKQELMQVVDLLLGAINKTLAGQKVSVALTDAAKAVLVDSGYDPRLGARPLRRVVQRTVESVVAKKLLGSETMTGQTITLDAPEITQAIADR